MDTPAYPTQPEKYHITSVTMVPSQQDIFCSSRHIDCILPDESLLLPRLLCLHGGGTNALIFHAQCRAIRARLDKTFRFVFINAPYFSHPGPDVESVYAEWIPFRSWKRPGYAFDNDSSQFSFTDEEEIEKIDQCLATAMNRDDEAGGRGPWVGLLGFSQGANMAASLLRRQQTRKKDAQLGAPTAAVLEANFRFAVLMAGCGPLLWMRYDVTGDELEREKYERLYLPTLHVHGLRDERIAKHRELVQFCRADTARVLEWDGDHRIPIKSADVAKLVDGIILTAKETGVFLK